MHPWERNLEDVLKEGVEPLQKWGSEDDVSSLVASIETVRNRLARHEACLSEPFHQDMLNRLGSQKAYRCEYCGHPYSPNDLPPIEAFRPYGTEVETRRHCTNCRRKGDIIPESIADAARNKRTEGESAWLDDYLYGQLGTPRLSWLAGYDDCRLVEYEDRMD